MSHRRIAVIGAGISGLGAAYALKDVADVDLWEARERLGGHANTVDIDYDGDRISVDTGFIVFNDHTYPNMIKLFDAIGAPVHESNMSFGFSDGRIEWSSNPEGLFAQRSNLFRPSHLRMLREIVRFNHQARTDIEADTVPDLTLGGYLRQHRFSGAFRDTYLLPMGAAIWSTTDAGMADQPAATVLKFFHNHRLLYIQRSQRPRWKTVKGGSRSYVSRFADILGDRVKLNARAQHIRRMGPKVIVTRDDGSEHAYDEVVLACHSDQALALLADPSEDERQYLGAIQFAPNIAVLHRDTSIMPRHRKAWAAWNYRQADAAAAQVTYNMNLLQGIADDKPLFVTLNPQMEIDPDLEFGRFEYDHPQFNQAAIAAQRQFNVVQGVRRTWFAGAWLGYGFHEDGLRAGLRVALKLGGSVPWTFVEGDVDGGPWLDRNKSAVGVLAAAE